MDKGDLIKNYFNGRHWSLFVVLPIVGFSYVFINFPVFLALRSPSLHRFISYYEQNLEYMFSGHLYVMVPIIMVSLLSGLVIQGVSVMYWHWSKCRTRNFMLMAKGEGACSIETLESEANRKDRPPYLFCERYKRSYSTPRFVEIVIKHMVNRMNVSCRKEMYFLKERKSPRAILPIEPRSPIAGTLEYAEFQVYLESKKDYGSYIEYEKFISSLYEFTLITFLLSLPLHYAYLLRLICARFADTSFIVVFFVYGIITWILFEAAIVHRKAAGKAVQVAYRIFTAERGLIIPSIR